MGIEVTKKSILLVTNVSLFCTWTRGAGLEYMREVYQCEMLHACMWIDMTL